MRAIFCALEEEIRDLKLEMKIDRTSEFGTCKIREGQFGRKPALLVTTGMGREKAEQAAVQVLENYPVSLVISTGFGGALNARSKPDDILVCPQVRCAEKNSLVPLPELESTAGLVRLALEYAAVPAIEGRGVTTASVCSTPGAKHSLGIEYGADVVDMESYWIGRQALKRGIPFLAVRSIFDAIQDDLSFLERLSADGKIVPPEVFKLLCLHPGQMPALIRLYRRDRKASAGLSLFFKGLLSYL
jgi:adenosylhomocysteine nucleosidase